MTFLTEEINQLKIYQMLLTCKFDFILTADHWFLGTEFFSV